MTTRTVYPGIKPDGTRVSVLAQDLVTPIPNDGATVTNSEYYETLVAQQILIDYNPVLPAGPPIDLVVAPVTVVGTPSTSGKILKATSATQAAWQDDTGGGVSALEAALASRPGVVADEALSVAGLSAAADGDGATWRFALGVSSGAAARARINAANGQWQRVSGFGRGFMTSELAGSGGVRGAFPGETIQLHGRTAYNDGGQGVARWDSSSVLTEDGATVWGTGTGRWRRLYDQAFVNVKWFGAKGDIGAPGSDPNHDDQPAIQAAINAAFGYGADIYIPYGMYRIKSTLKMKNLAVSGPNYNGRIRGDSYGGYRQGGTKLVWGGPYHPLFTSGSVACVQANAAGNYVHFDLGFATVQLTEGVHFLRGASNTTCATNLAAAINGHATLGPLLTASGVSGACNITAPSPASLPTGVVITTDDATAFVITGDQNAKLSVLFQAGAPDCTFESIEFVDAGNAEAPTATRCACLVNIGGSPGEGVAYNEHMTFRHCKFTGGDFCVVFDYNLTGTGNSQDNSFSDCLIDSARIANVWFRHSVQPYSTNFYLCYVTNFKGPNPDAPPVQNTPYGVGWLCDTESSSITIQDCDIQRFGVIALLRKAPTSTLLLNNHAEVTKKLLVFCEAYNTVSTVQVIGGRYSEEGVGMQSYGPLSSYAAANYEFITGRCAASLLIQGTQFSSTYAPTTNWFIACQGNDLVSRGNRYPNLRPFKRRDNGTGNGYSQNWPQCRGRTFSEGDYSSQANGNPSKLPVLRGCENGGGRVTFAVGESSKHITFDRDEPSHDQVGNAYPLEYMVNLTIQSQAGAFTQPSFRVSNKTRDGFDIVLTAAVPAGDGNAIEIAYDIWSGGYMP